MKYISKNEIIELLVINKDNWDIDEPFASDSLKDLNFTLCRKYGSLHYKTIYTLLMKKLDTFSNKLDKLAYLDCLIMNYKSLQNNDDIDLLISILSGSFLGVSFLDTAVDMWLKIGSLLMILYLVIAKTFTINNKKWKFYVMILEQLKSELE